VERRRLRRPALKTRSQVSRTGCQADLAALDVRAILICGDRDRHVPLRNHLATQQAISRCGLQVYFDVGHVPFVETPERCAADVERFRDKIC
jgi:sigma-B regulation protein RsbQ